MSTAGPKFDEVGIRQEMRAQCLELGEILRNFPIAFFWLENPRGPNLIRRIGLVMFRDPRVGPGPRRKGYSRSNTIHERPCQSEIPAGSQGGLSPDTPPQLGLRPDPKLTLAQQHLNSVKCSAAVGEAGRR